MNRGVEIELRRGRRPRVSLIQDQVEMGVAVRMAVLASLAARRDSGSMTAKSGPGRATAFVNARLVDPESGYDGPGSLVVADGVIADVARRPTSTLCRPTCG